MHVLLKRWALGPFHTKESSVSGKVAVTDPWNNCEYDELSTHNIGKQTEVTGVLWSVSSFSDILQPFKRIKHLHNAYNWASSWT
jgi:hypothetical protein